MNTDDCSDITIRPEHKGDARAIDEVLAACFPTLAEAMLVRRLRDRDELSVSILAETVSRDIVGYAGFSPVTTEIMSNHRGAGLAPVAVLEAHRRQGVTERMIRHGVKACASMGFDYVVVLGEPGYYKRFGFHPARRVGLRDAYGGGDVFGVMALSEWGVPHGAGLVRYSSAFDIFAE